MGSRNDSTKNTSLHFPQRLNSKMIRMHQLTKTKFSNIFFLKSSTINLNESVVSVENAVPNLQIKEFTSAKIKKENYFGVPSP